MKLLIVEPEATGHRMALYVKILVRQSREHGWTTDLLTTRHAVEHPAFRLVEQEASKDMRIYLMDPVPPRRGMSASALMKRQLQYYFSMRRAFSRLLCRSDHDIVYLSTLDYIDKVLAILGSPFGSTPFAGMMMAVKYHRSQMNIGPPSRSDYLYEWLFRRVLRLPTLHAATIIDEAFSEYQRNFEYPEYQKLCLIPDTGELNGSKSYYEARAELDIPAEAFVILIYGTLSERKGISALLDAMSLPQIDDRVVLVLAGSPAPEIIALLNSSRADTLRHSDRLKEYLYFHDQDQEYCAFRAADVVWVGYVDGSYGSSGVLYQAGSLRLPVLATKEGLIGWLTRRHNLGLTFDPLVADEVANAIYKLQHNPNYCSQLGAAGALLATKHTAAQHGNAICRALYELNS